MTLRRPNSSISEIKIVLHIHTSKSNQYSRKPNSPKPLEFKDLRSILSRFSYRCPDRNTENKQNPIPESKNPIHLAPHPQIHDSCQTTLKVGGGAPQSVRSPEECSQTLQEQESQSGITRRSSTSSMITLNSQCSFSMVSLSRRHRKTLY